MIRYLVLFSVFLCVPLPAKINDQQLELQHAGMMGTLHLSYGIRFFDNHVLAIGAGTVQESSHHQALTLLSLKYRYNFDKRIPFTLFEQPMLWQVASLSVAGIQGHHDRLYAQLPNHIPDGYYLPSANRLLFGLQSTIHLNNDYQLYWDWSVLDVGLINLFRNYKFYRDNYDYAGLGGVVSYGFGIRVTL